jgi:hypothetical protein
MIVNLVKMQTSNLNINISNMDGYRTKLGPSLINVHLFLIKEKKFLHTFSFKKSFITTGQQQVDYTLNNVITLIKRFFFSFRLNGMSRY